MYRCIMFLLNILIGLTVTAETINLSGNVSNKTGKPVSGAIVTLLNKELKDTTGSDGNYSIIDKGVAVMPLLISQAERLSLKKGILEISLPNPSPVKVEIFDLKGKLLKKESFKNTLPGIHRINITDNYHSVNMMVIRTSIGNHVTTFSYLPMKNGEYAMTYSENGYKVIDSKVAKIAADIDSLKVTADGYKVKVVTISSYDGTVNVTLDTVSETVCEGCGKTNHPASGKASIDVDGTKREYILKLPDDYDPNKSYKLIFCIHAWGGNFEQIAQGGYYGLEKLSNGSAIFVSPQGLEDNGNPRGWANPNGRDIKFVKAIVDYFNSTLCIDQKRIFSTGFSYGGMMSYAIGCALDNVFRAIAPMSGSFYSGCDKTTNNPIAVWMAHGKTDGTVPLEDGQTALNYFLAKNGCSNETTPVDPSPCVAYKGCTEGFPIVYCEFDGGHAPQNWAQAATWAFFSQF